MILSQLIVGGQRRTSNLLIQASTRQTEARTEEIRNAATRRLLARASREGLYLYDRQQERECLLSWEALERLQQELSAE